MRAALVALFITAAQAFGKEPTQQDYDIWAATLAPHVKRGVYLWHTVEPASVFARGLERSALGVHPEFRPVADRWLSESAEIDIERLNAALAANKGIGHFEPVKLLDQQTLEAIVGRKPKAAWIVSPRLAEGVKVICRLSWPAVREDGRAAYTSSAVSSRCGKGLFATT